MESITKVMNVEVKNVPWRFCPIFTFGFVRWRVGKIAADFYPQPLKNRLLQPVYLLRIVTQLVEMLACVLPCSGVTHKWHLSRSFYAGPWKWRENNGAKMTSWSRKKFPVRVSKTKLVKITLPCLKSLTAADLSHKDDFDQLFNFQGPVISECTIVPQKLDITKMKVLGEIVPRLCACLRFTVHNDFPTFSFLSWCARWREPRAACMRVMHICDRWNWYKPLKRPGQSWSEFWKF